MARSENKKPVVTLRHPSYQPSKAEMEEDVRVDVSFQELTRAVVKDVTVKYTKPKSRRPRSR